MHCVTIWKSSQKWDGWDGWMGENKKKIIIIKKE
jgi:hypothetical protein